MTHQGVTLEWLQDEAHRIAMEHGWWDKQRSILELLMLVVTEVTEAAEAYRTWELLEHFGQHGKPEGFASELADILIRVGDLAEHYNIDLTKAVQDKMDYNVTRSWRHGGKLA